MLIHVLSDSANLHNPKTFSLCCPRVLLFLERQCFVEGENVADQQRSSTAPLIASRPLLSSFSSELLQLLQPVPVPTQTKTDAGKNSTYADGA